jgi:putative hydrolase of the HAD superfamily
VPEITTLFFDIGGVVLTNGWDRHCRRTVIEGFGLDHGEFQDRHDPVAHDFETGRLPLARYLERTVFYRARDFTQDEFFAAMKAQSRPLPGGLELLDELAGTGLLLTTLNNESRELNEHRIDTFGLRDRFTMFLSSCYLGVKKPEPEIYRMAFQITQVRPEQALFIDDRPLNLECALDEGLHGVRFDSAGQLRGELADRGVLA